jgi:hypothetical protein
MTVVAVLVQAGFQALNPRGQFGYLRLVGRQQALDQRHHGVRSGCTYREYVFALHPKISL